MDNYTDVLKVLREPNEGPRRKRLWQSRRFWIRVLTLVAILSLIVCIPYSRALAAIAIGDACLAAEDKKDALMLYEQALSAQPDSLAAMDRYANLLVAVGRENEALPILEHRLEVDRGTSAIVHLTQLHLKLKNYDAALQCAEKWIASEPKNSLAYRCRGRAYEGLGKYDRAFADYDQSTKMDPRSESTTDKELLLEKTRFHHHNFEALTDPVYENDPGDYYALVRDGVRQFMALEQLESLETLGRAIKMRPNDPLAYIVRGRFELTVHRFAPARDDLLVVGKLWKDDKPFLIPPAPKGTQVPHPGLPLNRLYYYIELGKTLLETHDYKGALENLSKAVSINPDSSMALFYRAKTYRALGRPDLANNDMHHWSEVKKEHPAEVESGALLLQGTSN